MLVVVLQLKADLTVYYGYNTYLLDQLTGLFSPGEVLELCEACETPRPVRSGRPGGQPAAAQQQQQHSSSSNGHDRRGGPPAVACSGTNSLRLP
jgi:hypothetical protein